MTPHFNLHIQTIKHIHTSPSSVEGPDGTRRTRASKAALNGMTHMTVGAIADAAVKVRSLIILCYKAILNIFPAAPLPLIL